MVEPREEQLGSITFLGKGEGPPTHAAPPGSRYTDILIPAFYCNMDGYSTGWALEAAPVTEYLADLSGPPLNPEGDNESYHSQLIKINKRTPDWDGQDELDGYIELWVGYVKATIILTKDTSMIASAFGDIVVSTYECIYRSGGNHNATPVTTNVGNNFPSGFVISVNISSATGEMAPHGCFYVNLYRQIGSAADAYKRCAIKIESFVSNIGIYDTEG